MTFKKMLDLSSVYAPLQSKINFELIVLYFNYFENIKCQVVDAKKLTHTFSAA